MAKKLKIKKKTKKVTNKEGKKVKQDEVFISSTKKKNLCLILSENKSVECILKGNNLRDFSFRKNHYFIIPDATYITTNNIRLYVFLEGISTPLSHKNIETIIKNVEVEDLVTGKKKTKKVSFIKGLKYDSKLIDMLLNKGLFKEFLTNYFDLQGLIILIMLVSITVIGIINAVLIYLGLFGNG